VESNLGVPLSIRQRSGLRRQCSAAKERLLNDADLKSVEVSVLGNGSSLISKSLKTEILQARIRPGSHRPSTGCCSTVSRSSAKRPGRRCLTTTAAQ
jgi:hypothetical protein